MLNPLSFFSRIFKSNNENELNKIRKVVNKINNLEKDFINLDENQLKKKTNDLVKRVETNKDLSLILPEAFGLVREASKRVLKERHFDVQLIGGVVFVYFVKIKDLKSLAIILKGISFFWVFFTIFNLYLFPETLYLTLFVFMPLIINFYGLKNVKKEIILQLNKKGLSDKEIHLLQLLAGIKKK